jgi:riboflavin transporter FmnP
MMQSLYPSITPDNIYDYYIPLAALPFNALRCIVCSVITYFVYKPVSRAMRWERKKAKQIDDTTDNTQKD